MSTSLVSAELQYDQAVEMFLDFHFGVVILQFVLIRLKIFPT